MAEDFSIESTMGGSAIFAFAAGRGEKGHRIVKWGGPVFAGSKRKENVLGRKIILINKSKKASKNDFLS